MSMSKPIAKRALSLSQENKIAPKKPKTDSLLTQWKNTKNQIESQQYMERDWFSQVSYLMDAADEDASNKFGRDIVKQNFTHQSDIHHRDRQTGDTPLQIAAKHGNPILVACLLALRADHSSKTMDRKTLREIACTEIISPTYIKQLPSYEHTSVSIQNYATGVAYACQDPEFPPYKQIMDLLTEAGCPP